jgi:hypothetical protein
MAGIAKPGYRLTLTLSLRASGRVIGASGTGPGIPDAGAAARPSARLPGAAARES